MITKYRHGNILELASEYDILVHGCNCFNKMGSGVALQIAKRWPEVLEADARTRVGDIEKLGSFTAERVSSGLIIINAYTQYNYGRGGMHFSYEALEKVLSELEKDYGTDNTFIAPKIGSGLAGGSWDRIASIIEKSPLNFTIVIYDKDNNS